MCAVPRSTFRVVFSCTLKYEKLNKRIKEKKKENTSSKFVRQRNSLGLELVVVVGKIGFEANIDLNTTI
jgi:hypothetical protein